MLVPYSAQFSINNKKKQTQFNLVNNQDFFHKDLYSSRINKITKINSAILYQEDELIYDSESNTIEKVGIKIAIPNTSSNIPAKRKIVRRNNPFLCLLEIILFKLLK